MGRPTTGQSVVTHPASGTTASTPTTRVSHPPRPAGAPYRVGVRTLTLVDTSRTVTYPGESPRPRPLVTIVRYPQARGRFPLIVFGHGFAVTPTIYAPLLHAWAQAGYVVAAPIFPLGNGNAPGGPNESDLVNQPRDVSFVITRLLALSAHAGSALSGRAYVPRVYCIRLCCLLD